MINNVQSSRKTKGYKLKLRIKDKYNEQSRNIWHMTNLALKHDYELINAIDKQDLLK